MGKKRVAEAEEGLDNPTINNIDSELPEKKMKTQASDTEETDAPSSSTKETDAPSTSTKKSYANPMENKKEKRRKNKIRHLEESEIAEPKPKKIALELKNDSKMETSPSSSGGGNLPQFHIGVFKDLSAADSSAREAAVVMLVTELQEVQKAYEQLENKEAVDGELKLEADMEDGLDMCAPSLRYAVRRLIRGVSSSREYARPGFALGLSILVSAVPSIRTDSLLKLIVHLVEITSSMKGQEKRDCLLGRLFAYGAISRSGRLTEEFIRDKDTPYIKEFISAVLVLANKKRYLQEPAVSIIWELAEKLPVEALQHHFFEAPEVQEWFGSATEKGNPDALLLALKMRDKVGVDDNTFGNLLPSPYSPSNLFSADHLSSIALCLKESTFCQPRIHSVWPTLLNILLPDSVIKDFDPASVLNSTKKHKKSRKGEDDIEKSLRSFCEVILDGSLLSSSHDRKNLAFDILLLLLPKLPAYYVNIVLSHKLVQCLMDVLSTKDTWLFKVAEHFMKELSEWVKNDNVRRVAVIVALQRHSNGRFDSITRTKTVKILMMEIKSESACMHLLQELMSLFLDEGHTSEEPSDQSQTTDENSERGFVDAKESNGIGFSDILKSWVIESLPGILKHLEVDPNSKFKVQREILKFLVVQGLFSSTLGSEVTSFDLHEKFKWPKSAISSALCRMCIEQLQSLLSSAQKGEGSHALAVGAEANDLGSYFMHFVNTLRSIPSVSLYRSLNDDDEQAFKKINEMEALLAREERNYTSNVGLNKCHVLRYLLIQLLLQILLRPGEFYEAASELVMCCKATLAPLDLLGSSGEDEPVEDGAPLVMEVLVDTMLSLLPQSSAPMRTAIEQTFKYFCEDMTDDGLVRMLRIVKKDLKPARRHNNDGDDEDDDDILGIEDDTESDEDETSETAESDKQNDDSEAVKGADEDRAKLQDASDESDGGMDDDAMFRMDTYLARIFKERKNQHSGDSAPSQLILFKLRVLSLLEIYLHENPGDPRVLTIFQNLAQALINPYATKGSEQLSQRIWGIMQKKIFKAKVFPRGESIQLPSLESLLEKFLKLTSRPFRKKTYAPNVSKKKQSASWDRHKMINSLAQNSTFWILKIIESKNFSKGKLERTFEILSTILVDYFDSKKSLLKPDFLKEIFKRRPWVGRHLCNFLLEKCIGAKLQFRQVEGLDLVLEVLKSLAPASSDHDQAKKTVKKKVPKLCHLIKVLVTNMPEKKSRRADVKKFCSKVFGLLSTLDLSRSFLKALEPDAHAACESQLGDTFLALTKRES